jgi:hypothetical protein
VTMSDPKDWPPVTRVDYCTCPPPICTRCGKPLPPPVPAILVPTMDPSPFGPWSF